MIAKHFKVNALLEKFKEMTLTEVYLFRAFLFSSLKSKSKDKS